eukprot:Polyplicarium_translucidae@DN3437_c0_g1_i1.p2
MQNAAAETDKRQHFVATVTLQLPARCFYALIRYEPRVSSNPGTPALRDAWQVSRVISLRRMSSGASEVWPLPKPWKSGYTPAPAFQPKSDANGRHWLPDDFDAGIRRVGWTHLGSARRHSLGRSTETSPPSSTSFESVVPVSSGQEMGLHWARLRTAA